MRHHLILRVVTKLLVPPIILFALYVQFHGDYSPGGGFQAGVIFAAGLILFGIVYGLRKTKQVFPPWLVHKLAAKLFFLVVARIPRPTATFPTV